MSLIRTHTRLLLVAVACVALGAGASLIANAGASTGSSAHHARSGAAGKGAKRAKGGSLRRFAARAVQGSVVVHTKKGFGTVSFERGKVDSVNGQQLMITEGTPKASYKTVTLTIPANAIVRDNRQKASLSAVKSGQRVVIVQAPKRTLVVAHTARTP
ncbi:MAG: hypothetical protein WAK93_05000 [Solirubrobacteraceae bacterium]